jgi:hypothetical protein
MADERKPDNVAVPEAKAEERKAYRAPKLRRLGSVRDLTLGSKNGKSEGGGLMMA